MRKSDFGQTISIFANLSVLAGILLLAYELNQNNRFAEEQAQYASLQESLRMNELIIRPEYARLYYRATSDDPLSDLDQQRRSTLIGGMFSQWEWIFQRRPGSVPAEAFRGAWQRSQPLDVWQERRSEFTPEFVLWMEENIVFEDDE
jgi:hypothetical protein